MACTGGAMEDQYENGGTVRSDDLAKSSSTGDLSRREFLELGAAAVAITMFDLPQSAGAQRAETWNQGQLIHLIPTASHERILIKASFKTTLTDKPRLSVNGKPIEGVQTDLQGRFWRFDVTSLHPATQY